MCVIAIDLGGTSIKYALVSQNGVILHSGKADSHAQESAQAVLDQLTFVAQDAVNAAKELGMTPQAIGIGSPGITDATGRILVGGAENIVGWEGIELSNYLEERFQIPTRVDNDANLMGLGEQAFGAARGCSDVIFITVGTGIGGAVVIDGKLFRGFDARGTELGHFPFIANGEACACGAIGCWEQYASTTALVRNYAVATGVDENSVNGEIIVKAYHEKDPIAVECLELHTRYVAQGIAGLVNIFSPQKVIIGGGISESGNYYLELINEQYKQLVMAPCAVNTQLSLATLGNKAGIMGAAQLAFSLLS